MDTVSRDITVDAPIERVFAFWQNPLHYARFMADVQSVEPIEPGTLSWKATSPDRILVEWRSRTVSHEHNREIAWEWSGATLISYFRVNFDEVSPDQTMVAVQMDYTRPQPSGGATVKNFTDPADQLEKDLQTFKTVIESGE